MRIRLTYTILASAWWSLIWFLSGPGTGSRWTQELLHRLFGLTGEPLAVADFLLRKSAHIGYYFLLTLLVCRALRTWNLPFLPALVSAAGFAFLSAILDEYRQSFAVGRSGTWLDLLYDTGGIALAIWFLRAARCKAADK